jgi:hypothetical protein
MRTAPRCCTNEAGYVVCSALNSRTLEITPNTIKNCFVKCDFSADHISSNDDSAVKLNADEEDDLGVQSEDYTTCDSALEVCGVRVLTRCYINIWLGQKNQKRKLQNIKQHSWMLLKDWKQPESTRQFDTKNNVTVMCNKAEYELYRLRDQGEKKWKTDCLKKYRGWTK